MQQSSSRPNETLPTTTHSSQETHRLFIPLVGVDADGALASDETASVVGTPGNGGELGGGCGGGDGGGTEGSGGDDGGGSGQSTTTGTAMAEGVWTIVWPSAALSVALGVLCMVTTAAAAVAASGMMIVAVTCTLAGATLRRISPGSTFSRAARRF